MNSVHIFKSNDIVFITGNTVFQVLVHKLGQCHFKELIPYIDVLSVNTIH